MSKGPPPDVEAVFAGLPPGSELCARELRKLVLDTARSEGVAAVQETRRWGEPAYLPGRAGTTVRIGCNRTSGDRKFLVHCQTSLVGPWRMQFGDRLTFEGNRGLLVAADLPLDEVALQICVVQAFADHSPKQRSARG